MDHLKILAIILKKKESDKPQKPDSNPDFNKSDGSNDFNDNGE